MQFPYNDEIGRRDSSYIHIPLLGPPPPPYLPWPQLKASPFFLSKATFWPSILGPLVLASYIITALLFLWGNFSAINLRPFLRSGRPIKPLLALGLRVLTDLSVTEGLGCFEKIQIACGTTCPDQRDGQNCVILLDSRLGFTVSKQSWNFF